MRASVTAVQVLITQYKTSMPIWQCSHVRDGASTFQLQSYLITELSCIMTVIFKSDPVQFLILKMKVASLELAKLSGKCVEQKHQRTSEKAGNKLGVGR